MGKTAELQKTRRKASEPKIGVRGPKTARKLATLTGSVEVLPIRQALGLTRKTFSRLSGYSERTIAAWENGGTLLNESSRQRMTEMQRLQLALSNVMKPDFIPRWLQSPNDAFGGLKPIEVVERGEIDRVWRMVYDLESGMPG